MNKKLLNFQTYLFDLDGTLINTEPLHHLAYQVTLKEHGFTLPWDFNEYLSHALVSRPHLYEALYQACPGLKELVPQGEVLRQRKILTYDRLAAITPPQWMPGAPELLELLLSHKKELAIVTNSPKRLVDPLTHLPFSRFFKKIITIDDFSHPKPHPAGYNLALSHFNRAPEEALVFEDSLKGVQSAKAAGTSVILIASDHYCKIAAIPSDVKTITSLKDLLT